MAFRNVQWTAYVAGGYSFIEKIDTGSPSILQLHGPTAFSRSWRITSIKSAAGNSSTMTTCFLLGLDWTAQLGDEDMASVAANRATASDVSEIGVQFLDLGHECLQKVNGIRGGIFLLRVPPTGYFTTPGLPEEKSPGPKGIGDAAPGSSSGSARNLEDGSIPARSQASRLLSTAHHALRSITGSHSCRNRKRTEADGADNSEDTLDQQRAEPGRATVKASWEIGAAILH
ncbi:hypothetical protein MYCTH_2125565 [Thermothelomyces thermophilus ATCC 42464]|uniref:Uncharacterized protein n=1 Tax=Thermothelomyces thermophilus (strain ATCC 42464 / BCRC 31852 / DSM 1799) TaxID=573729 RepID=G2Q9W9_THET4|nr:uncharacterized protein MYCTH_2125565 [Thermothelomyces thermophilus ATCC 42464]AEO56578.1 hypothetical protein MYCTH_2125565 [Thermothelomyces thermophilus ATCC 42464]